jgi:autotransporter-associated beta strand protein
VGVSQTWTNNSVTALNLGTTFTSGTSTAAVLGLGIRTLTLDGDGNFNFGAATTTNAVITGSTGSLIKNGAGTVTIGGVNTYGGSTTISGGKLTLAGTGSIANSPSIIVGASTTFDVSGVTGGYTLGASQTLSGSGSVTGAMTVSGTLSPGNSPGIMTTGSQTWANGADYNFQMLDATGTAGTGYDQIAITGTLNLSDLTAGGFGINIWSLSSTGPDVSGNALNFNNSIDQSWTILTTTEGITGFDAGDFLINLNAMNGTNGFSNALGGGVFSLSATPNNLILNYTAVPEPNAALLGSLSILALLRRRR